MNALYFLLYKESKKNIIEDKKQTKQTEKKRKRNEVDFFVFIFIFISNVTCILYSIHLIQ